MTRHHWLAGIAAVVSLAIAAPATAAGIVYDPTNYAQNVLQAARALEQVNNQIRSLQNEAQMLMQGAKNLTSLDFSALAELRANLAETQRLIGEAEGLTFDVERLEGRFDQLYPATTAAGADGQAMAAQARERWAASLAALRTTMQMQSQVAASIGRDEAVLADLSGRSQSAVGLLQAVQATNELLALQAKQAMQGQQLQLAQDRAAASEAARALAADERARARRERFKGTGTYTPAPVQAFRGDGR
jgi:P-type conjugative transfer protein TrbJ